MAQPQSGASVCHIKRYSSVETSNVVAPSTNDVRLPLVSATRPVGTSKSTCPSVKNALAVNACALLSPASSRNSVFTPQMSDVASVDSSVNRR